VAGLRGVTQVAALPQVARHGLPGARHSAIPGRPLTAAATAPGWRDREGGLAEACEVLLDAQRARGLPAPAGAVTRFWDRPYRTVDAAVAQALLADITDPQVSGLPALIGSIEQWASSVDILSSPARRSALRAAYPALAGPG
jgi:hypothetical protein